LSFRMLSNSAPATMPGRSFFQKALGSKGTRRPTVEHAS